MARNSDFWIASDDTNDRLFGIGSDITDEFFPPGVLAITEDDFLFVSEIFAAVYTTGWNWGMALTWSNYRESR